MHLPKLNFIFPFYRKRLSSFFFFGVRSLIILHCSSYSSCSIDVRARRSSLEERASRGRVRGELYSVLLPLPLPHPEWRRNGDVIANFSCSLRAVTSANSSVRVQAHFKSQGNLIRDRPAGHGSQLHDLKHVDQFVLGAMRGGLQRRPTAVLPAGGAREQYPGVACQPDVANAALQRHSAGVGRPLSGLHIRLQRQRSQRGDGGAGRHSPAAREAIDVRVR